MTLAPLRGSRVLRLVQQSLCQQVSIPMELRVCTLLREACDVRASAPRPRRLPRLCSGRLSWHREKSPPRARRRAAMALNLASGNFDARPTAGLARASTCSTEPVPASQHPCMQLLNDRWTHGAARAHVHRTIHPTTELFIPFTGSDAS